MHRLCPERVTRCIFIFILLFSIQNTFSHTLCRLTYKYLMMFQIPPRRAPNFILLGQTLHCSFLSSCPGERSRKTDGVLRAGRRGDAGSWGCPGRLSASVLSQLPREASELSRDRADPSLPPFSSGGSCVNPFTRSWSVLPSLELSSRDTLACSLPRRPVQPGGPRPAVCVVVTGVPHRLSFR